VSAPDRPAAIERMKRVLDEFVLLGVRNNIEFLRRIIDTDDFAAGRLDTGFLERHRELFDVRSVAPPEAVLVASLDGTTSTSAERTSHGPAFTDVWHSGDWRNT